MAIGDLYKDGHSTTDQGVHGKARSKGSSVIKRDMSDAVNFWGVKAGDIPDPRPLDASGVPERWCSGWLSGGHYSPVTAFRKDKSRNGGLDHICKQCRKELEDHQKTTAPKGKTQHG